MIVYTVHEPGIPAKSLDERSDEVVFVKEGFTLWGFLFAPLWLLFNALWFEFIGALLLAAAVTSVLTQLELKDQAGRYRVFASDADRWLRGQRIAERTLGARKAMSTSPRSRGRA